MPSSSGPRWAMMSHIRRRMAASAAPRCPNSTIPAIPHMLIWSLYLDFASATNGLAHGVRGFKITLQNVCKGTLIGGGRLRSTYFIPPFKALDLPLVRHDRTALPLGKRTRHEDDLHQTAVFEATVQKLSVTGPATQGP